MIIISQEVNNVGIVLDWMDALTIVELLKALDKDVDLHAAAAVKLQEMGFSKAWAGDVELVRRSFISILGSRTDKLGPVKTAAEPQEEETERVVPHEWPM